MTLVYSIFWLLPSASYAAASASSLARFTACPGILLESPGSMSGWHRDGSRWRGGCIRV